MKKNLDTLEFFCSMGLDGSLEKDDKNNIMTSLKNTLKNAAALVGMCLLLSVISSQAANLTVTSTANDGDGSLRKAINDARVSADADNIDFNISTSDPGFDLATNRFTINLLESLPDLPSAVMNINNFQSQGITIKGNDSFRIFTLLDSAVVIINNLTISNGFSDGEVGGGIFMGDSSTLTLNGSTISDNIASGYGGGIYMSNSSTLFLANTTITRNTGSNGGGIFINNSGTLHINTSTINSNSTAVGGNGGGIYNGPIGTINATNSTIDSNTAQGGNGGGIYNTATITFTSSTITDNNADNGGGIHSVATATLNNNLIALNTAPNAADLLGNAFTGDYNLVGDADGSMGLPPTTNQLGTTIVPIDPLIGTLSNNGGLTLTRALLNNSRAIDKGSSPGIITDQRGQPRPVGNRSDIGAYEAQFAPTAANVSVVGRAMNSSGRGIRNVMITLTDANGIERTAQTTAFGYYHFDDVTAGETVTLTAKARRFKFNQSSIVRTTNESINDADFISEH